MSNYGGWPGQPGPGTWVYTPPAPKPGVIPLHPLSLADVLTGIFGTLRQYFKALYAPLVLLVLATGAITAAVVALSYSPLHTLYTNIHDQGHVTGSQSAQLAAWLGGIVLLCVLHAFCAYSASGLISSAVLRHAVVGRRATVRQILAEAATRLWPTVGGFGLLLVAYAGPLLVAAAVTFLLGVLIGGAGVVLGFLLIAAAFGWMILVGFRMALLAPVIVLENQGPKAGFARAWRLNQGNWWRTVGFTFVTSLMGSFATQIVNIPVSLLTSGSLVNSLPQEGQNWTVANMPSFSSLWMYLIGFLITLYITGVLILPLLPLCNGLLYIDRRIRRESLDEQLAAEAGISLTSPPPGPPPAAYPWQPQRPTYPWQSQPQQAQPQPGQPPYGQHPYGQPPYGQQPYGGWPGQQQPQPGWPATQPVPPPPPPPAAPPAQDASDDPRDAPPGDSAPRG
jgi:hypothetical protein